MINRKIILICIIVIAVFLRFWRLTEIPPSLSWDEAAIGYNAYSILKTGKDEYGASFPVLFRSFDDSKLPGIVYLAAVSEAFFGLNEFGVRFPSAFFGVLTVLSGYFLVKKLLGRKAAILAGFLFAINPWLVNFSRQAFETNISMSFFLMGILFMIKAVKDKNHFLILSFIFFAISIYFYYAARMIVPLIIFSFIVIYFDWTRKNKKIFILSGILALVILTPLLRPIFSPKGYLRISQVVITNEPAYLVLKENYAKLILDHNNSWLARIVYNRRVALAQTLFLNYIRNLSPEFIFYNGTGGVGLLYIWEIGFFFLGFYSFLTRKEKWKWLLFFWFLFSIFPSSLTKDQPNPLRTLIGAPAFILISFFGIFQAWEYFAKKRQEKIFLALTGFTALVFLIQFAFLYFEYSPKTRALDFGDGYKQLAKFLEQKKDAYDLVWVSGDYWRPYIHLLFHLNYDPAIYQTNGSKDGFGKFRFGKADWDAEGIDLAGGNLMQLVPKYKTALFIFSDKEFDHITHPKVKFEKALPINGKYAKEVFWAVDYSDYLAYLVEVNDFKEENE